MTRDVDAPHREHRHTPAAPPGRSVLDSPELRKWAIERLATVFAVDDTADLRKLFQMAETLIEYVETGAIPETGRSLDSMLH